MHENTQRRLTFLINLMFHRLDKYLRGIYTGGLYSGCSLSYIFGGHINWILQ